MTTSAKKAKAEPIADLINHLVMERQVAQDHDASAASHWAAAQEIETKLRAATTDTAFIVTIGGKPTVLVLDQTGEHTGSAFHQAHVVVAPTDSVMSAAPATPATTAKPAAIVKAPAAAAAASAADGSENPDDVAEQRQDELIVEARGLATRAAKVVGRDQTVALIARVGKAKKLGDVAPERLPELIAALTASLPDAGGDL